MPTINKKSSRAKSEKSRVKPKPAPDKDVEGEDAQGLPAHPKGRPWKARHVAAARMYARGATWPEISQIIGVQRSTAEKYPKSCDCWSVLFRHFRAQYLAELEDRLFEPALNALYEIVTTSKNEFARIQALSLVFGERNRAYGRLDSAMKRSASGFGIDGTGSPSAPPMVIDTTIQAPDDIEKAGSTELAGATGAATQAASATEGKPNALLGKWHRRSW